MSNYVEAYEVSHLVTKMPAESHVEWADGSGATSYAAGFIVLWDSHSNPIVVEEGRADMRQYYMGILETESVESWPWDEWHKWCDYPDDPMPTEDFKVLQNMVDIFLGL